MKNTKFGKLLLRVALCALAVLMLVPTFGVAAVSEKSDEVGYNTYTYWYEFVGKTRKAVYSKPMYEVYKVFSSHDLGCSSSSSFTDVCTSASGKTYLLDGNASTIHIVDENYNHDSEKVISYVEDNDRNRYYFNRAQGIFVDKHENIYIAATEHGCVYKCDIDGKLIKKYVLPSKTENNGNLIPDGFNYRPQKVAVDNDGYIYILSQGSYYGAILYAPDDETNEGQNNFLGFYGANDVPATITQALMTLWNRLFVNNAKRSAMVSSLPYTFSDLWVDQEGFVYTVTGNTGELSPKGQVKRLNPGGSNVLSKSDETNFVDEGLGRDFTGANQFQNLKGVAVDKQGFIHVADSTYGRILIYDKDCTMLSALGGGKEGRQDGTFMSISDISYNINNDDIVVADSNGQFGSLTIFRITEYGKLVKSAQAKTVVGEYEDAEEEWKQVLALDGNCQVAYSGLAKANYIKGKACTDEAEAKEFFEKSIELAKQGYDRETYALAFGAIRTELIRDNFTWIMLIIVLIIAAVIALLVYSTKHPIRLIKNEKVHLATTIMTHPFDNFREIKEKGLTSFPVCLVIIVLFYVFTVFETTAGGFAFVYFDPASYNALLILAKTVGLVILWTVANWAVCTLMGGKGKVKEIFTVICYSLIPMLLSSIVFVVCSNFLVPDEAAFLTVLTTACTLYSLLLIVAGSMIVHDYSFGKFLWSSILTLFGCAIVVFMIVTVIILMQQTWGFLITIGSEIIKLF